jgi:hypothetical protein
MTMLKDFKEFINKGNVFDLAIGVMIGGAFGKIVTSLVNDIVMPPIGAINKVDLTNLFISLNGIEYPTLKAAKDAGAPTLNLGKQRKGMSALSIENSGQGICLRTLHKGNSRTRDIIQGFMHHIEYSP